MITRRSVLLAGTALGARVLAGQEGLADSSSETSRLLGAARRQAGETRKTLQFLLPEGCRESIAAVGKTFEAATGVGLEYREVPVDQVNTHLMVASLSKRDTFHLALPPTFGIPDLAETGCILPLDEWAKEYEPASFRSSMLYSIGDYYKGRLYGYQTDGDVYGLFYNERFWSEDRTRERFESEHGFSLGPAKTWKELDTMMEFFSGHGEDRTGGTLFRTQDYIAWEWWMRFHSKGLFPVDDEMRPRLDRPEAVQALEELIRASRSQYPEARTNGLFQNWKAFAKGDAFCNIGWGGTQKYLLREDSDVRTDLAFGLAPGGDRNGTSIPMPYFNWGWNFTLPTHCPDPELAYLFSLYATSTKPSIAAIGAKDSFFDPFREEHYGDPDVIEAYSADYLQAHRAGMEQSIPDFYLAGQGEYFSLLREFISRADQGRIEPAEALAAVAGGWEQITERKGRDSQIEQWLDLKSRYPEAAQNFLR